MSAPERFQVGDTVRCVNDELSRLTAGAEYAVTKVGAGHIKIDGDDGDWFEDRFVLVSRPTPSALDPFAWTSETASSSSPLRYNIEGFIRWSRFCYWCASVNLAAHFLPTQPAARTRASNGRDVPAAYTAVMLPTDVVMKWAAQTVIWHSHDRPTIEACRRALGAS